MNLTTDLYNSKSQPAKSCTSSEYKLSQSVANRAITFPSLFSLQTKAKSEAAIYKQLL